MTYVPMTAEQRAINNEKRKDLVGKYIESGDFMNYKIKEHIHGSQYLIISESGESFYASHNIKNNIWKRWETR